MLYNLEVLMTPERKTLPQNLEQRLEKTCESAGHGLVAQIRTLLLHVGGVGRASVVVTKKPDVDGIIDKMVQQLLDASVGVEWLDEAVHDMANNAAATTNNAGMEAQLRYLIDEAGVDAAQKIVDDLIATEEPIWFLIALPGKQCTVGRATPSNLVYISRGIGLADGYTLHEGFHSQEQATAFARDYGLTIIEED